MVRFRQPPIRTAGRGKNGIRRKGCKMQATDDSPKFELQETYVRMNVYCPYCGWKFENTFAVSQGLVSEGEIIFCESDPCSRRFVAELNIQVAVQTYTLQRCFYDEEPDNAGN